MQIAGEKALDKLRLYYNIHETKRASYSLYRVMVRMMNGWLVNMNECMYTSMWNVKCEMGINVSIMKFKKIRKDYQSYQEFRMKRDGRGMSRVCSANFHPSKNSHYL